MDEDVYYVDPVEMRRLSEVDWFPIDITDLRHGDTVRFRTRNGRKVEGRVERDGNRGWRCDLERIAPADSLRWRRDGILLERRGLPVLTVNAGRFLDEIQLITDPMVRSLARENSLKVHQVFDLMSRYRNFKWWYVWDYAQSVFASHARTLPASSRPFLAEAGVAVCAMALSVAMPGDRLTGETRALLEGAYRASAGAK